MFLAIAPGCRRPNLTPLPSRRSCPRPLQHVVGEDLLLQFLQFLLRSCGFLGPSGLLQLTGSANPVEVQLWVPLAILADFAALEDDEVGHQLRSLLFHSLALALLNRGADDLVYALPADFLDFPANLHLHFHSVFGQSGLAERLCLAGSPCEHEWIATLP